MAAYCACHCSVKSIDHLGAVLKATGKGSPLENLRLHRTKCTKLITNVIAPEYLKDLVKDIRQRPYALIVDEATDVTANKFMGICVMYYSESRQAMVVDFLGMVEVSSCTGKTQANKNLDIFSKLLMIVLLILRFLYAGENLATALKAYLKKIKLPLKNLNAIGTDGANNMCGKDNSFYTHLKKDVPGLILLKCTCHSIDKSAQYAFKKLPGELSYLLNETANWFAHSAKRLKLHSDYYKVGNVLAERTIFTGTVGSKNDGT